MVRVARAMIETAKSRSLFLDTPSRVPTPSQAWAQITRVNADALGWSDSGLLSPGAWADLVVIDPRRGPASQPGWRTAADPLSLLLYTFDERWIGHTLVQGRIAYTG
jgi:cytosine/adenosine deaminase-related metal-dependent hydrolase